MSHDENDREARLAELLRPGQTPPRRALGTLVDALEDCGDDDKTSKAIVRALLRAGEPAAEALLAALDRAQPPGLGRLARALARFAQASHAPSRTRLCALLDAADEHARRVAINAIGQWTDLEPSAAADLETRLLARWHDPDTPLATRRALARTLGRIGTTAAADALADAPHPDDPELNRIVAEARLMLARRASRSDAAVAPAEPRRATLERPARVEVRCRRGLEKLLADELTELPIRSVRPGRVVLDFAGPLETLFAARTMLDFGFTLPPRELARHGDDAAEALADALCSDEAHRILDTFSPAGVRYRIEWAGAGKQRGATWRCVRRVAERCPELLNDPSERSWEVVARAREGRLGVTLMPHLDDPRFTYRVGDVPAASHPTLAAALARVAGARPSDVVWDPFVGSGTELIERARLGPFARLVGSDLDPAALEIARGNLTAAGLEGRFELRTADALSRVLPDGADLILTNPPMGRRISNEADVTTLLERFVAHAARALRPEGRLVWLTPFAQRTNRAAEEAGLRIVEALGVDMGGFSATLQRLEHARR